MADYTEKLTNSEAMGFIDQVGSIFKSLPHLPKGVVEFFVAVTPWLTLIGAILGLVAGPLIALLGSIGSLFSLSPMLLILTIASVVLLITQSILSLIAFPHLRARRQKGWVLLFWNQILSAVSSILSSAQGGGSSLIGAAIGVLIGLYFLFEMRSSYGPVQAVSGSVKKELKSEE